MRNLCVGQENNWQETQTGWKSKIDDHVLIHIQRRAIREKLLSADICAYGTRTLSKTITFDRTHWLPPARHSSFFLSFHFDFKFPPKRRCNTYSKQPFFSIPDLLSCYMLPQDMHSTARCSFHPATSLCLLAGIRQLILPWSHGGPFVSAPNLIIPANASITPP